MDSLEESLLKYYTIELALIYKRKINDDKGHNSKKGYCNKSNPFLY